MVWPACTGTARPRCSDFFPTPVGDGIAAFVELDMVNESLYGFVAEAAFPDALGEDVAAFVAPAELGNETVPDVAFFVGARGAVGVRPGQHGLIGRAGERTSPDFGVGHAEETAAASVEREWVWLAQVAVVSRGKPEEADPRRAGGSYPASARNK